MTNFSLSIHFFKIIILHVGLLEKIAGVSRIRAGQRGCKNALYLAYRVIDDMIYPRHVHVQYVKWVYKVWWCESELGHYTGWSPKTERHTSGYLRI